MSRSSSMGDLVPKDITEILALQNKVGKSKTRRGSSLGRAFSWFKGSKRTRSVSNDQSRSGGHRGRNGEATVIRQVHSNQDSPKAGQKQEEQRKLTVHYTASQHYQENVFIKSSRPKYLEDLHTEAQEGLKILQQEEHNNGINLQDDRTVSIVNSQQEEDSNRQERDGLLAFDSTDDNSITSMSTVSAMSLRPVLTRQGSTFKPLNTVKRLDKSKKRNRRTTIMGIPQHVQREICMERDVLCRQHPDTDDTDDSNTVIIPTSDGRAPIANYEGARVHLQDIEALQDSRDEPFLRHHIQTVYKDANLTCKLGPQISPMQRPKSLAVPEMTISSTFPQEPQGPVMSISPQATYLSKIIPNAILPAAIDVIEIDRSRSRRSVRRVSKTSSASPSPGSSHSGSGTNDEPFSTSSNQSHSQSSETIVSNSSTISLKRNAPSSFGTDCMKEVPDLNHVEERSTKSSASWFSSTSKADSQSIEQEELNDAGESAKNGNFFSRSLSVMKAKLPPAPPTRTYSLHSEKMKRSEVADKKYLNNFEHNGRQTDAKDDPASANNEKLSILSPMSTFLDNSQSFLTSSPHNPNQDSSCAQTDTSNSSSENKFERTMSPSSGYSSQSGTPTHSSKDICTPSPGKQKIKPPKPERMCARTSPAVSVTSSMASLSSVASEPIHRITQTHTTESQPHSISIAVTTVNNKAPPPKSAAVPRELFNIPPPPKVKAPCPPPPETWAHNKRTIELLCGSALNSQKIFELQKHHHHHHNHLLLVKNQNTTYNIDQTSSERRVKDKEVMFETKKESITVVEQVTLDESLALGHMEGLRVNESLALGHMEGLRVNGSLALGHMEGLQVNEKEECSERETANYVIEKQERNILEKKSPINSKKVPTAGNDEKTVQSPTQQLKSEECEINTTEKLTLTLKTDISDSHNKEIQNHMPTKNLDSGIPTVIHTSPPPSPPPTNPPSPPPSKTFPAYMASMPPPEKELHCEREKEFLNLECVWPPPPPPMNESVDLVFDGQDESEFPPPPSPPLLIQESLSNMPEQCNRKITGQTDSVPPEESYDIPDAASHVQQNPELIVNTTLWEKNTIEQPTFDSILSVPKLQDNKLFDQSHDNPQFSEKICMDLASSKMSVLPEISASQHNVALQPVSEEISSHSQEDSSSPLTISATDLLRLALSDVPVDPPTDMPPIPKEDQSTINFRRQPNMTNKDNRSKELLSKHKSAPIPKEDANIPLVTPSLLQMVRLRSVNVEDQVDMVSQDGKDGSETSPDQNQCLSSAYQVIPQKPIRKSCSNPIQPSVKSPPPTLSGPSMRLQEAIRMKTAAMSSSGLPPRPNLRVSSPTPNSNDVPLPSPKTPEGCDLHKSPASTASFIFSKSTKKVVIETSTSSEGQACLKENLAAELMQITDQAKSVVTNGTKKHVKVPPPVAKKPVHATNLSDKLGSATIFTSSSKQKNVGENIGQNESVPPAGQCAHSPGNQIPTNKTETANTLEKCTDE